jgi:two-component system response regulator AlgR
MTPLRVMITDDEAPARHRLRELLSDCAREMPLSVVAETASGAALLEALQDIPSDVVLLDIRMPGMDGIETARHLQKLPSPPRVVFTTAYERHALEAFEVHAVDYLLKPVRARRLQEALARARSLTTAAGTPDALPAPARTHFSVTERGRIVLVPVREVRFLRAELKYVTLRTASQEHVIEESLTRLEEEFGRTFVRIHRSCLVAVEHLLGFERQDAGTGDAQWAAVLADVAERLPVSRRQAHVVREFGR